MPDGIPVLIIIIFIGLAIAGAIFRALWEKKRREGFQTLAQRLRMRYTQRDDSIADRYRFLDKLRQGRNRYAFNVLVGQYEGHTVQVFDYHYRTGSGKNTKDHYLSFFILEQEKHFPELRIYPEGIFQKLGQMIGFNDIDFESIEFSRAFCVRSRDRKFAYDICHTRMMEYLLQHRDLSIEIEGRCVAISFDKRLDAEQIPGRLRQLVEIRDLFPKYLLAD